jgi:hypothetical protein
MNEYKITYKDGRTQAVTADGFERRGNSYDFWRSRRTVFSIDAEQVETVGLADIAEPSKPAPRSVGV